MSPFNNQQLEIMMADLTSDRVERQQSFEGDAQEKVYEAICALANNLAKHNEPGIVLIGVCDDAAPMPGFVVTNDLLIRLASIKTDGNILPLPSMQVEKRYLCGHDVVVVTVWHCDTPPVRFKGQIFVRLGARQGLATVQDEDILCKSLYYQNLFYDVQPRYSAQLDDLDRVLFERTYLPALLHCDIKDTDQRSYEQKLVATKMILSTDDPVPTTLGLLIIGKSSVDRIPGAYTQFLRVEGNSLGGSIDDEATFHGPIFSQIRQLEGKILSHNRRNIRFFDVSLLVVQEHYPTEALRELILNAYMHRSYEKTNAPIRVYWFNDRIEIISPGGPYGAVTQENFGTPGITSYRNPNLVEALYALRFVQHFGSGIARARSLLGQHLSFWVDSGFVKAIIRLDPTKLLGKTIQ
jgi:ATP-dependent DNA helicase RecG